MSAILENWQKQLAAGLDQMGLEISQPQQQKLLAYLALLSKWNQTYNLTAIRDPDEMVARQLLDSLSILPLVRGERILDVGSGAGLPGIPLAICMPETSFTLIDSNGKKSRFIQQARIELELDNLEVYQTRVEQLDVTDRYDTITSRAFASLPKIVELTRHLLSDGGILLSMKGLVPKDEIETVKTAEAKIDIIELNPPLEGERHAVVIKFSG